MAEGNKRKITFLGNDGVQDPEMIIDSDKNDDRKKAFHEAYKRAMQIVPEYFMARKKRKNGSASSGGFSQSIIVTPENIKVETKEVQQEVTEEKEIERED